MGPHDRDEAIRWLKSMPFASKYLFTPTDTMSEQLKGQWNTLPMGKKKGGLCQRNPQAAKQIIEKFGSFLSFLIRLYPTITGKPQGSVPHQEFEKMFIEQVYKKLEGKIK